MSATFVGITAKLECGMWIGGFGKAFQKVIYDFKRSGAC